LERALTLLCRGVHGNEGAFPEFISSMPELPPPHLRRSQCAADGGSQSGAAAAAGHPPFNDENMIMLSAVARVAAPAEGGSFDAAARSFHAAMAQNKDTTQAAAQLAGAAHALAGSLAAHAFTRADSFAALEAVLSGSAARYTDYKAAPRR